MWSGQLVALPSCAFSQSGGFAIHLTERRIKETNKTIMISFLPKFPIFQP
jgi:hypothetical protein